MGPTTQMEVVTIGNVVVGHLWNGNPDWQIVTNVFTFGSLEDAKNFAARSLNRHTTVVVTDVTDERDIVLLNSKSFAKIPDAKRAIKALETK